MVVTGVLIAAVDTTIVVLALPVLERSLHVPLSGIIWVIVAYLLVMTILSTQVGRLGDMFGRVRMYEMGFGVFVLGSLLCALATGEATIVGFRIMQGVGGALISANSGAVIADIFPPERRGRAYGYTSVGWSVGAVLGILLGGLITTYVSWRWIFGINVPIGVAAIVLALRVLRDRGERRAHRVDVAGMALLGGWLFCVLWAITRLATSPADATLLGFLTARLVLLVAFVAVEHRQREPMLDFSFFRVPTTSPTLFAALLQSLANFATLFLVTMYQQGVRQLSPLHASLVLVPGYLVGGFIGPLGGRLADRLGAVYPATVGLAIQCAALVIYANLGLTTPLWIVVLAAIINGMGAGAFFPANNAAVMKAAPGRSFGVASGVLRTFANVGMVFSFSMAILIAASSITRGLAFAIFVGSIRLQPQLAQAFTTGVHST